MLVPQLYMHENVQDFLRAYMKHFNIRTYTQIERDGGPSYSMISAWLRGKKNVSMKEFLKLLRAYNCHLYITCYNDILSEYTEQIDMMTLFRSRSHRTVAATARLLGVSTTTLQSSLQLNCFSTVDYFTRLLSLLGLKPVIKHEH